MLFNIFFYGICLPFLIYCWFVEAPKELKNLKEELKDE